MFIPLCKATEAQFQFGSTVDYFTVEIDCYPNLLDLSVRKKIPKQVLIGNH